IGPVDYIINMASESHVDRSIVHPVPFVKNNVDLVLNMLEYARAVKPKAFIQVSTDEVYGPMHDNVPHPEWDTILPSNAYSASKACQEAISFAYWRSYGVPVIVTNCWDMQTRVMTTKGFKGWEDINAGDDVWTLSETGELITESVIEKVKMPG